MAYLFKKLNSYEHCDKNVKTNVYDGSQIYNTGRQDFTNKINVHDTVLKNIVCVAKLLTFYIICKSFLKPAVSGTHKYILRVQNTQNS
jgi:hypothetical protein